MVDACTGNTGNAVALWVRCTLILILGAPDALEQHCHFIGRTVNEVKVDDEKLKTVLELCYLGDLLVFSIFF